MMGALFLACRELPLAPLLMALCVCVCVCVEGEGREKRRERQRERSGVISYEGISPNIFRPSLLTSFNLNCSLKVPISKYSHMESKHSTHEFGSTIQSISVLILTITMQTTCKTPSPPIFKHI
jgi:hypothetical protein